MADRTRGGHGAVDAALSRLVPEGSLGVAVSGGSDSMALLSLARGWAKNLGRGLQAVTVDHGLRAESAAEASVVARTCAEWGIPHTTLKAEGLRGSGNLQANARDARYRLIAAWARREGHVAVALGHTMDDQAETVLMRLGRGAGAEGLSAMAASRDWLGMRWVRPLLGHRRAALREYLVKRDLGWIDDPSNDDPRFDRVKARQALEALAPLGIGVEALAETAATMMRQRQVLTDAMERLAGQAREWGLIGEVRLSLTEMSGAVFDTALRLFADSLMRVSGSPYRARFRSVEPLYRKLTGPDPDDATVSGCLIRVVGDALVICREPAAIEPHLPLESGETDWDQRWRVSVSSPHEVLVGPLGSQGRAELQAWRDDGGAVADYWALAPAEVQVSAPAIWQDLGGGAPGALLAVPHAGYAADGTAHLGEIAVNHLHTPKDAFGRRKT